MGISVTDRLYELAQQILAAGERSGCSIATAESCTGGLIGAALTAVPGMSALYAGGVIAYENRVKEKLLGVSAHALETQGAVSASVVAAMAAGVRRLLGADCSVAVTGIAGPSGGTDDKPVGLVFLACASATGVQTVKMQFDGTREQVRQQTVLKSLEMLLEALEAYR